ncbi:MAG TPA: dihydrodipicolinate synthase family protein [Thermomicrobiales bacterium]|nr:dihydrodipicolinate synthase family protein [Thermomicrobiales bacterium]
MADRAVYRGVFPIAPTTFNADESIDEASQRRAIDFMVDAGVDGICILANYSEQFSLTDAERDRLQAVCLEQVDGRVPVIVTTSHFSSRIAAERSRTAQEAGAAMVMLMPPYHGATLRVEPDGLRRFFSTVADAIDIPIMIQDAPMSGTVLPAGLLADLAKKIPQVQYLKVESPKAAEKLKAVIELAGDACPGPFDGEEGITLIPDLEAGATGTMPSAMIPEVHGEVLRHWREGHREDARDAWEAWLPMIHYENRQCGLLATKTLMREGGVIASDMVRAPLSPLSPMIREGLLAHARRRDPLVLRWARDHA